jgi:hypothetical protein
MSIPKKHHFVPESYLNGFTEDEHGFLNVYSKRTDTWRKQKPKQVMHINNYYHQDWAPEGVDKNILEKYFGTELESKGLTALRKLISAPETLDGNETAEIIVYLQYQRLRVPRQADMAKALAKIAITKEISKSAEGRKALEHGDINVKDSFRMEFMRMMHDQLSPYFSRMIWEVVGIEKGLSFITSDSPVSFYNVDCKPPIEPGIALYGTFVLFPLNKHFLLCMRHPEYVKGEKTASDRIPNEIDVEDGGIEIRRGKVWDKERVQHHNWVMYQLSQDLIVGETKEVLEHTVGKALT